MEPDPAVCRNSNEDGKDGGASLSPDRQIAEDEPCCEEQDRHGDDEAEDQAAKKLGVADLQVGDQEKEIHARDKEQSETKVRGAGG